MAGLFAGIQLPEGFKKLKPTNGLVDIQPLDVAPAEEAFFGGYAGDFLSEMGADLVLEAPKARLARKAQS